MFATSYGRRSSIYRTKRSYEPDRNLTEWDLTERDLTERDPSQDDRADLQQAFVDYLFTDQSLDRGEFANADELRWQVLREDWPDHSFPKPVALPYASLGSLFKGREGFLAKLHDTLKTTDDGGAAAIVGKVVHGMGGVGKTRLAVEYARRHESEYSALLFVSGETPELLQQNLAALSHQNILNLEERKVPDQAIQVAAVLRWLNDTPGWLLILDNLDSQDAATAGEELLSQLRGVAVLLTSRLTDWGGGIQPLELDVLDQNDAARFLLERTEARRRKAPSEEAKATELAKELDGLALALEQAGAYISHRRIGFHQYLASWRQRAGAVAAWHDQRVMNYPRPLAITWETTIEQLEKPERDLLGLLAWMAPEPVPLFVFDDQEVSEQTQQSLALLASYSLVSWDTEAEAIRVHRVVQEIQRSRAEPDDRERTLLSALRVLGAVQTGDPQDPTTWDRWDPLRPHVAAATEWAAELGSPEPTSALLNQLGRLLLRKALFAEAEPLMRRALSIDETSFGEDHPEVAVDLNNLAQLLKETNRFSEAEPLSRRHVTIFLEFTRRTGHEHPHFQAAMTNYAQLLGAMGQSEDQIESALEALRQKWPQPSVRGCVFPAAPRSDVRTDGGGRRGGWRCEPRAPALPTRLARGVPLAAAVPSVRSLDLWESLAVSIKRSLSRPSSAQRASSVVDRPDE